MSETHYALIPQNEMLELDEELTSHRTGKPRKRIVLKIQQKA